MYYFFLGNVKIAGKSGALVTKKTKTVAFIRDRHCESVMGIKMRLSKTAMLNAMNKLLVEQTN